MARCLRTLGFAERVRAAGEGDVPFDYWSVAVANAGLVNVRGRSRDGNVNDCPFDEVLRRQNSLRTPSTWVKTRCA